MEYEYFFLSLSIKLNKTVMENYNKIIEIELSKPIGSGNMICGKPYTMHDRVTYRYNGVFYERLIGGAIEWYDFDEDDYQDDIIESIQFVDGEVVIIPQKTGRLDLINLHDY